MLNLIIHKSNTHSKFHDLEVNNVKSVKLCNIYRSSIILSMFPRLCSSFKDLFSSTSYNNVHQEAERNESIGYISWYWVFSVLSNLKRGLIFKYLGRAMAMGTFSAVGSPRTQGPTMLAVGADGVV